MGADKSTRSAPKRLTIGRRGFLLGLAGLVGGAGWGRLPSRLGKQWLRITVSGPFPHRSTVSLNDHKAEFVELDNMRIRNTEDRTRVRIAFTFKGRESRDRKVLVTMIGRDQAGRQTFCDMVSCGDGRVGAGIQENGAYISPESAANFESYPGLSDSLQELELVFEEV